QPTWAKITQTFHGKGQPADPRGPKSPEESTGRASVLIYVLMDVLCVLTETHGRPVCADGHTWTSCTATDSHERHVCWRTPTDTHGHTRTATDVLCVLPDSHGQPWTSCVCWQTPTDVLCLLNRQPTWAKITQTSTGRVSVLSPRTNVLICVLMDSHGRPVCADGHTKTHTDSYGRPPRTSCVCWRTPTDVLCVLTRQPTWAKITRTVHGKGQRAESKYQHADMCTDGQSRTSSPDVLCELTDTHECHVCADGPPRTSCPTLAKITQTVHGKGQHAESKDQLADMCTDGQPQTSSTDVLCVLEDTHGHPVHPTWAKITRTVHGKGQRAESKDKRAYMCSDGQPRTSYSNDQRADMCTDGQPQTSCVC
ncbi:unnamed protein product, partial [Brassica rapa]